MSGSTKDRDDKGRFKPGHKLAHLGWQGLINKRFGGNEQKAREWFGKVGAWAYAKQAGIYRPNTFRYPGKPEEFIGGNQ